MEKLITKSNGNYNLLKPGSLLVIKLPWWKEDFILFGSWADEWRYMVARIEHHNWCTDFDYKIHLVPVGKMEGIGVERSWYTSDIVPFSEKSNFTKPIYLVDSIEEGEKLVEKLNNEQA